MQYFKQITMGSAVIMGRKTLDSIGCALPGRQTIVITRGESIQIPSIQTARSIDEAYSLVRDSEEIFEQAMSGIDKIYATEVDATIAGADTFFPELDSIWKKTKLQSFPADDNNIYSYSFVTYER